MRTPPQNKIKKNKTKKQQQQQQHTHKGAYFNVNFLKNFIHNGNAMKFILLCQVTASENEKCSNEFKNLEEKNSLKR